MPKKRKTRRKQHLLEPTPEIEAAGMATAALSIDGAFDIPAELGYEEDSVMEQMVSAEIREFCRAAEQGWLCRDDVEMVLDRLHSLCVDTEEDSITEEHFLEVLTPWVGNFEAIAAALEPGRLGLHWATTVDHDEDWFIVAKSAYDAARGHEEAEGYDVGDARAVHVVDVPDGVKAEEGWPNDELLVACGCEIVRDKQPRVVRFKGKDYVEGALDAEITQIWDDQLEANGLGRPNGTEPDGLPS